MMSSSSSSSLPPPPASIPWDHYYNVREKEAAEELAELDACGGGVISCTSFLNGGAVYPSFGDDDDDDGNENEMHYENKCDGTTNASEEVSSVAVPFPFSDDDTDSDNGSPYEPSTCGHESESAEEDWDDSDLRLFRTRSLSETPSGFRQVMWLPRTGHTHMGGGNTLAQ